MTTTTKKIYTLMEIEKPENFSFRNPKFDELTDHYYLVAGEKIFITVLEYSQAYFLSGFGNAQSIGKLCFTRFGDTRTSLTPLYYKGQQVRDTRHAGKDLIDTNYKPHFIK